MESRDWSSDVCSSDLFPSHDRQKEEETLKSAIDNLNSTALKILESWRGTLIGNEGAIRDVIGGSGMVNVINMAPLVPFADGGIVTSATNALIGEAGYPEAIIPLKDGNGLKVDISGLTPLLEELITKQGATEQTMNRIKTLLERVAPPILPVASMYTAPPAVTAPLTSTYTSPLTFTGTVAPSEYTAPGS